MQSRNYFLLFCPHNKWISQERSEHCHVFDEGYFLLPAHWGAAQPRRPPGGGAQWDFWTQFLSNFKLNLNCTIHPTPTHCWSVLDFWKINLEKSSSTNWIFSLFRTKFLLHVHPAKFNFDFDFCRLKIRFVDLKFSNLIFQNSSTDQQGARVA